MPARAAAVLLCAAVVTVPAAERLTFKAAGISGPGGRAAAGIKLDVDLSGPQPAGTLTVRRLDLGPPLGTVENLRLHCAELHVSSRRLACPAGGLTASASFLSRADVPVAFEYRFDGPWLSLTLPRLVLTFNAPDGSLAAQDLKLGLRLKLRQTAAGWTFTGRLSARSGQAYADPVFVDFGAHPASLEFAGTVAGREVKLSRLALRQPGVVNADGSLQWVNGSVRALAADVETARLPAAYVSYLQPFVIGTPLDSLQTAGRLRGSLRYDERGFRRLEIVGSGLDVDDRDGRLRLHDGSVDLHWRRDAALADMPVSRVDWSSAAVYRIGLGGAGLTWRMAGDDLVLAQPARLPLLGGALRVDRAEARDLTGASPAVDFNAQLTPINLSGLCKALGWPVFGGSLSGAIPHLQYRDGELLLAGGLTAEVFDGQVRIEQMQLAHPFGARPRLSADVHARNLDLKAVTGAFSFGRITGRLDADVTGLRMLGWLPVAFDAWLRTPVDDHSRHRISQRAIDDLTQIGGGGAALLSRGFLRLFDEFAYDRIGIGCELHQGICRMRGLAPADNGGFVLVRGAWLPRVDVIGYNRRVSWPVLLEQLQSVTAGRGPVVNPGQPPVDSGG